MDGPDLSFSPQCLWDKQLLVDDFWELAAP